VTAQSSGEVNYYSHVYFSSYVSSKIDTSCLDESVFAFNYCRTGAEIWGCHFSMGAAASAVDLPVPVLTPMAWMRQHVVWRRHKRPTRKPNFFHFFVTWRWWAAVTIGKNCQPVRLAGGWWLVLVYSERKALLVADLLWEKSTAGWWLISQANRARTEYLWLIDLFDRNRQSGCFVGHHTWEK
jgi:hypothetical protein